MAAAGCLQGGARGGGVVKALVYFLAFMVAGPFALVLIFFLEHYQDEERRP